MMNPSSNEPSILTKSALPRTAPGLPQTTERNLLTAIHTAERINFCDDNHSAMKAQDATWQAALFGGYQSLGAQLGEIRYCPVCQSSVGRYVPFTAALIDVLDHLLHPQRPTEIYVQSASMLAAWAQSNLPGQLGLPSFPAQPDPALGTLSNLPSDWRPFGQELRRRRESAGLSRMKLSTLAGVADSTIRNFETGRHRPTVSTVRRITAVPALTSASPT